MKFSDKKSLFLFLIFTLLLTQIISAQPKSSFRRHFIIACDMGVDNGNDDFLKEELTRIFCNPIPADAGTGQFNGGENNGPFFDPSLDEITCVQYGVSMDNKIPILREFEPQGNIRTSSLCRTFADQYIRKMDLSWSGTGTPGNSTCERISGFVRKFWLEKTTKPGATSDPSLVNPFALFKLPPESYASSYILVLIAKPNVNSLDNDFSIYSGWSAAKNILRSHRDSLLQNISVKFIYPPRNNGINTPGVQVFTIQPRLPAGKTWDGLYTADMERVQLEQHGWNQELFDASDIIIKADSANPLRIDSIRFYLAAEGNQANQISEDALVDLVYNQIDRKEIVIRPGTLAIPSLVDKEPFPGLEMNFTIFTKYPLANDRQLNWVVQKRLNIPSANIQASLNLKQMIMILVILSVVILILLGYLAGRPTGISYNFMPLLDTYESSDLGGGGRRNLPHLAWTWENVKPYNEFPLVVYVQVNYLSKFYWFNWKCSVRVSKNMISLPDHFKLSIKSGTDTLDNVKNPDSIFILQYDPRKEENSFCFVITQSGNFTPLNKEYEAYLSASLETKSLYEKFRQELKYPFYIGQELGDTWMGIDPGTTGTCMAIGRRSEAIFFEEDSNGNKLISPSRITFRTDRQVPANINIDGLPTENERRKRSEKIYYEGYAAEDQYINNYYNSKSFESIKKLLGYDNTREVSFLNGSPTPRSLNFSGSDLTFLLVDSFLKNFIKYLNDSKDPGVNGFTNGNVLESKRTVVTIPNNFTIKKIHDLLSSIKRLNQFKEIRYIYEAEAVFFYHLSKAKSQQVSAAEDILLFDMGGATINVTAVRYKLEKKVHHVEILSRKGYSIGGDSIDYFLQEHFFNRNISHGFPAIKELITEPKNFKNKALQLFTFHNGIKALKHEISENYHKGKKELLEINTVAREYEKFIDKATELKEEYKAKLKAKLDLLEDLSDLKTYKVLGDFVKTGKDEKYNFLKEEHNKNLYNLYQNELFAYISDAITDTINESRKNKQDGESPVILKKVIISGRSTLFPNIRNLILEKMGGLQSLKANEIKDIMLTGSELKTAVAHGACWYGINRNNVHLDNFRSNAYFGVKETLDPQKTQVLFHPVIKPGQSYAFSENQAPSCENTIPFDSDFRFDDGLVEFYMAMGSDPLQDILNGRKEKYQMLRDIRPGTVVKSIKMKVSSNDEVKCMVKTVNGKTHEENPLMQNQDIHSSNNKHYTFWTDTE